MFSTLDDSLLVNQYISGDEKSLEILLKKYKRIIFKTIVSKVKSTEEILLIIASMGVVLSSDNPLYPQLEHLLDKEHPIKESQLNK